MNQESLSTISSGKIVCLINGEFQEIEDDFSSLAYGVVAPISTIYAFTLIAINFGEAAILGFAIFALIVICATLYVKINLKM